MLRFTHAALGAALALTVGCSRRADDAATVDSAALPAATPLTGDSAAPAAATPPAGAADSAKPGAATATDSATLPAAAAARSTAPVAAGRPSAPRTGSGAAAVARSTSPVSTASMTRPASVPRAQAATPVAAGATAPTGGEPVVVNKFMSYDAAAKTVKLEVTAALTSQRGGFNFNGGSDGSQTITVPQGWTVRMHVRNVDAIPHSAILILDQKPLPNAPETPAISRAYTSHVSDGLPAQTGEDDVEFRASKAGNFLIFCGVPGHGPSGMYIRFVVSADATAPSYTM